MILARFGPNFNGMIRITLPSFSESFMKPFHAILITNERTSKLTNTGDESQHLAG